MKRSIQLGGTFSILGSLAIAAARVFADPATQPSLAMTPATQPAVASVPATQPSAASVLADMDAAYARLQSAEFNGKIIFKLDSQSLQKAEETTFTSSFAAPNKFRHQSKDDVLLGSTGSKVYAFLADRNEYQNFDAPKARVASAGWPQMVPHMLAQQNPSLLLAVTQSASAELKQLSKDITLLPPTVLAGVSYDTLRVGPASDPLATLLVDPSTHLLHEAAFDMRKTLENQGVTGVNRAELAIVYTKVTSDAQADDKTFAWTAPAGAVLATATAAVVTDGGGDDGLTDELKAMIGKDAPDFTVKGLDDKDVKLSDLKGSVVVVDFWATWCGPCVASLPHLDKLYKDKSGDGLKVLAMDCSEKKGKVQSFVDKKGWKLPVVLDSDGNVAKTYQASAIPETVVIGKDGKIKQIFVGGGHEDAVAALVEKEMK